MDTNDTSEEISDADDTSEKICNAFAVAGAVVCGIASAVAMYKFSGPSEDPVGIYAISGTMGFFVGIFNAPNSESTFGASHKDIGIGALVGTVIGLSAPITLPIAVGAGLGAILSMGVYGTMEYATSAIRNCFKPKSAAKSLAQG